MKRFSAIIIGLFILSLSANAQVPSPTIKQLGKGWDSFLPKDWNIILADSADFDNDLREDFVFILQADEDYLNSLHYNTKLNAPPRILVILMGTGTDSLQFGMKSDSVVLRADGGEGDPLTQGSMKTDGNILELNYTGGLSIQWTAQYKFAYKNKDWTLASFHGTEYNTSDEDAPIKITDVDFAKKFMKQGKVKTPLPDLPKIYMEKFKPRTVTVAPGVVL